MARAACLVAQGKVEAREVKIYDPEPGGVLLKVVLGGVCGTDIHMMRGVAGDYPLPITLGHEGVGRIEKLGKDSTRDYAGEPVSVGDLVYWSPMVACNRCYTCTILESTPCTEAAHYAEADQPSWATLADYAWLPRGMSFFKLPEGASIDAIMSLGCALPTAIGSIDMTGAVKLNETVVVQGAGPVGLAATLVAKVSGARAIVVIDKNEMRLERARKMGATATLSLDKMSMSARHRAVHELCGINGPDLVVEAAGFLPAFAEGMALSGHKGRYCVAGLWGAAGETAIEPRGMVLKNLKVQGAMAPRPKYWYQALHLAARVAEQFPLAELITHRYGIGDTMEAFLAVERGEAVKAVIDPSIPS